MEDALVNGPDEVRANVERYVSDVATSERLQRTMTMVKSWYALETGQGRWLFGPSKFVGYRGNDAATFAERATFRDGGKTEAHLRQWFDEVPEGDPRRSSLEQALSAFVSAHGHPRPNAGARINVLKPAFLEQPQGARSARGGLDRIQVDPAICGGRPHVRGTRVRVSDILGMLAEGVSEADVTSDFPYLAPEDIRAALAYGAAASDHRVLDAA